MTADTRHPPSGGPPQDRAAVHPAAARRLGHAARPLAAPLLLYGPITTVLDGLHRGHHRASVIYHVLALAVAAFLTIPIAATLLSCWSARPCFPDTG